MQIKCPILHYELYRAFICKKDGVKFYNSGMSAKVLELPVDEDDVRVMVMEALDSARTVRESRMWIDGIWSPVDEVKLEMLLSPPTPKRLPKVVKKADKKADKKVVKKADKKVDKKVDEEIDEVNERRSELIRSQQRLDK